MDEWLDEQKSIPSSRHDAYIFFTQLNEEGSFESCSDANSPKTQNRTPKRVSSSSSTFRSRICLFDVRIFPFVSLLTLDCFVDLFADAVENPESRVFLGDFVVLQPAPARVLKEVLARVRRGIHVFYYPRSCKLRRGRGIVQGNRHYRQPQDAHGT